MCSSNGKALNVLFSVLSDSETSFLNPCGRFANDSRADAVMWRLEGGGQALIRSVQWDESGRPRLPTPGPSVGVSGAANPAQRSPSAFGKYHALQSRRSAAAVNSFPTTACGTGPSGLYSDHEMILAPGCADVEMDGAEATASIDLVTTSMLPSFVLNRF